MPPVAVFGISGFRPCAPLVGQNRRIFTAFGEFDRYSQNLLLALDIGIKPSEEWN